MVALNEADLKELSMKVSRARHPAAWNCVETASAQCRGLIPVPRYLRHRS